MSEFLEPRHPSEMPSPAPPRPRINPRPVPQEQWLAHPSTRRRVPLALRLGGVLVALLLVSLTAYAAFHYTAAKLPGGGNSVQLPVGNAGPNNPYGLPEPATQPPMTPLPAGTSWPGTPAATVPPAPTVMPTPTLFPVFCVNEMTPTPGCAACPYKLGKETETHAQILADIKQAAKDYGLPYRLLMAVTWDESSDQDGPGWHEFVVGCGGDVGIGQVKYVDLASIEDLAVPKCSIASNVAKPYDILSYSGNAHLTAKLLKWLWCFYTYNGGNLSANTLGTWANPAPYTAKWYYEQAHRDFPDLLSSSTPSPAQPQAVEPIGGLCAHQYAIHSYFSDLPASVHDSWPCPVTPTSGEKWDISDLVISAYNEGIGGEAAAGITNPGYISDIEGDVVYFANAQDRV